eukprot:SM000049S16752  [mRNA]  locus=s49:549705:550607:+ [translate_table: standard]
MAAAGVESPRLTIDDAALDTVTNFTTLVGTFSSRRLSHVYVLTSDYHTARASAVATLVLGSRGIAFTCVSLRSSERAGHREGWLQLWRDQVRATLWLLAGVHGAHLLRFTKPNRYRHHRSRQGATTARHP